MRVTPLVARLTRPLAVILVTAIVAGGIVAGARLTAGDPAPDPFTPQLAPGDPPPSITPRPGTPDGGPPPRDLCPSPAISAAVMSTLAVPAIELGENTVPLPVGASTTTIPAAESDGRMLYWIGLGNSFIVFDEVGRIGEDGIGPEDCDAFAPTVAALNSLAAAIPPPPLRIAGLEIPIPVGAHTSIVGPSLGAPVGPGGPTQGILRGDSYVRFNENGVIDARILPEDEQDFRPTVDLLNQLSKPTP